MENPIPFDWDGEKWRRFCVCWPDSPQWLALLRGHLTYATRGRSWAAKTGIIKDAQAIGWQIANNNLPLEEVAMSCSEANNVAKAIIQLTCAITGTSMNFDAITDLDEFFTGTHNFTTLGLANRIGPSVENNDPATISARMDQVRAAIEALTIEVNMETGTIELPGGEELVNIVTELNELGTIWETRSTAETVAQNTNFADLVAAIEALELQCQTIVETTNLNQTINCGGGSGSGGAGTYPADPSGQTTTPEDELGDPPPGFDSWAEFRQYQCDMAHFILDQMIYDIASGGLLAAGYATVATLAPVLLAALLTPIGWAEIIIIVGLWITIWSLGVNVSLLSQLLEDNREEFVCELLSGTSVGSSISAFSNLVNSKVDGEATLGALPEFIRTQVKNLISSYASIDSINRLYEKSAVPPPGGNDCSECGPETVEYTVLWGDETTDHPSNPFTLITAANAGAEANCGANGRLGRVTFDVPVTITHILLTAPGVGACGPLFLFYYYSNEDFTTLIEGTNARPQDSAPVSGVRAINCYSNADGNDPVLTITYTID